MARKFTGKGKRDDYWSLAALKGRGWSESLVRKLLGDPDENACNPHFICAAPQRLYLRTRVKKVEASAAFKAEIAKVRKRRRKAKRVSKERRRKFLEEVSTNIKFKVPVLEEAELIRRACDHYNASDSEFLASPKSSQEFLDRICVNYLRHCLTDYDEQLDKLRGQVGVDEARLIVQEAVYYAIWESYPHLTEECDRQLKRRWEALRDKI